MTASRAWALFVIFLFPFFNGSCAFLRWHQPYEPDLPEIRNLTSIQRNLQAADAASAHILLTEIGQVQYGAFSAPIWRLAYRPFQPDLRRALLLSGIHGNEVAGVDYILKLVHTLARSSGTAARWDMDFIPIINPWGWVHGMAYNPRGVDIGDDFTDFDSSEARLIRRFLRQKDYDLVIDLREDPNAEGFYIWQYGLKDDRVSKEIISRCQTSGYPIAPGTGAMSVEPGHGIFNLPLWRLRLMRLFRQLTIAGYVRQNVGSAVFTLKTPTVLPLAERIAMQQIAVETLLAEFGTDQ